MRPHHPQYNSLDLPGSKADATLRYVLAAWPIVDPYARYRFSQEAEKTRLVELSEGYFLTTDAMKEGSPFQILQRGEDVHLPPTLLIQGAADENLPVPVTERFVAAYREAGGTIEYEPFPDMAHGFGYTARSGNGPGGGADEEVRGPLFVRNRVRPGTAQGPGPRWARVRAGQRKRPA